jgi:hypothetical protein
MVFGQGSSAPQVPTLDAFLTNFCAAEPGPSPDAGGLMRSVMTQPGVYFTLDAPFVSIIGLYSNVLDSGVGVISSQGGHFPIVDDQLDFLKSELARLKPERKANKRAIIIAVHHPPLSADAKHGGSLGNGGKVRSLGLTASKRWRALKTSFLTRFPARGVDPIRRRREGLGRCREGRHRRGMPCGDSETTCATFP